MKITITLVLAFALEFAISGCSTVKTTITHGIPNLCEVEPGIWRGGQPNVEGWEWLKAQGIIFDLKLNTAAEGSDALAASNGLDVISLPITLKQQTIGMPAQIIIKNDAQLVNVGKLKLPTGGIFVHCSHGQDRTGLVIGAYRVYCEHWPKRKAYQEMLEHGFHPELLGLKRAWDGIQ